MLNRAVPIAVPNLHAQPVVRPLTVFELHLGKHFLITFRLQNRLGEQALVPQGQVMGRHGQFARRKHPSAAFFRSQPQRSQGIAHIRRCIGRGQLHLIRVPHRLHAQRMKDMLAQKIHELLAADFLYDQSGNHVICVRILPFRAWLKVQGLFGPGVQNLLRRLWLHHGRHQVVFGPIILVTRRVRKNLADRHFVPARQVRNIFADRVVQIQLALLLQNQNGRRRELL